MRTPKQIANLKPIETLSNEEAKKRGSAGGKKSGEVRKEKRLVSMIIMDYLEKKHKIELRAEDGTILDTKNMTTDELFDHSITKALVRGDSSSISAIKAMGELTEGNKLRIGGLNTDSIPFEYVSPIKKNESTD